jgi:hypothetical protein
MMSRVKHTALMVTCDIKEVAHVAHNKAVELFGDLVTELKCSSINQYYTFAVTPCGSKYGWPEIELFTKSINEYFEWFESDEKANTPFGEAYIMDCVQCVEILYGGSNNDSEIVRVQG